MKRCATMQITRYKGYEADIDNFLDSAVINTFGEWIVLEVGKLKAVEQCKSSGASNSFVEIVATTKGDLAGISSKLGGSACQDRPIAVVHHPQQTTGWSFRPSKNLRMPQLVGAGATIKDKPTRSKSPFTARANSKNFKIHKKQSNLLFHSINFRSNSNVFIRKAEKLQALRHDIKRLVLFPHHPSIPQLDANHGKQR